MHLAAIHCKADVRLNYMYINILCDILRRFATRCKIAKNGLKIRRKQFRGGSSPPPGTILQLRYVVKSMDLNGHLGALFLRSFGVIGLIQVQIQVQCASSWFSTRNGLFVLAAGTALHEIQIVYARLRNALRIIARMRHRRVCNQLAVHWNSTPRKSTTALIDGWLNEKP